MDLHAAIRDDRTLRRIIATLVAFAGLAEQTAARSFPVRFLALCILRHAEVLAWGFVTDATGMTPPILGEVPAVGNGPADAMLLAARFAALAAALALLLEPAPPFRSRHAGNGARRRRAFSPDLPNGYWPHKPNDTS